MMASQPGIFLGREPAMVLALVQAVVALVVAFGLRLSADQIGAILAVTAAARVGVRPSSAKRHLADLRARSGLTTEQLIYRGRAEGWLVVPSLDLS